MTRIYAEEINQDNKHQRVADLAWAAGIIDGEGCVMVARSKWNGKVSYGLRLTVKMTSKATIERLDDFFRWGRISEVPPRNSRQKPAWSISWHGKYAGFVLAKIYDYSFTKKAEIELAMKYGVMMHADKDNPFYWKDETTKPQIKEEAYWMLRREKKQPGYIAKQFELHKEPTATGA